LPPDYRGKIVPDGEITDFAPTIAALMGIDFKADGRSLIA